MRFVQGDMGMIRHMRRHGHPSGLNAQNIDDYCDMGEPVSKEDLFRMSEGEDPHTREVMTLGRQEKSNSKRVSHGTKQVPTYDSGPNTTPEHIDSTSTKSRLFQTDSTSTMPMGKISAATTGKSVPEPIQTVC